MAGAKDVTSFGVKMLMDEETFIAALDCPVLLWSTAPLNPEPRALFRTDPGNVKRRPSATRAMFFEVKKNARNAFAEEITVGRMENNDVAVEDNSVSRFHAYFAREGEEWVVVDGKSRAGTWLGGKRLTQGRHPVADGDVMKFGNVELRFMKPASFLRYLKTLAGTR
jgi:pSer/pThr/pTyr-binding forkhead associated (FHA) protein